MLATGDWTGLWGPGSRTMNRAWGFRPRHQKAMCYALFPGCCCIAAYGFVQRQLDIQLVTWVTGMMIGQQFWQRARPYDALWGC